MRWKTTLALLLLVLALGGLILGIERFLPSTRELMEMKRGPVKFDPARITQIDIDSSGGDGVSLAMDGSRWWVRRPFNDFADPEKVAKLLKDLAAIGWIQRVHRREFEDDAAWAKTSLGQPKHKLRLRAGGELVLECWIGAPSALEGGSFLALVPPDGSDEPAYYVAKTTLPDVLQTTPKNWRDPKLLRLPATLVSSITLTQPGGQIELTRKGEDAPWQIVKPLSTRGSKERIGELLSTLLNLEIKEAAEAPSGNGGVPAPVAGTELAAAELKIAVSMKGFEGRPIEISLKKPAKDATETQATVANRKAVFTVTSQSLNDLWAQPNDLRDRMLARINEDEVVQLVVAGAAYPPVNLRKQSGSWFLERNGKGEPANGDRIARFFDALNTQPILEFTADSASNLALYGLDAPLLTTSWQEAKAKPVKLLIGKSADNRQFYAKYEDEPSVYRIEASLLPSIPPDNIKWKGLGVLRFTQFALRRISLGAGTAPPVVLNYDPTTAQWTCSMAGRDVTAMLDRVKADKLAGQLSRFSAQDWATDVTDAIPALQKPELRVVVTLGEPGTNTGPTRDLVLSFAPTQPGAPTAFYFGQLAGDPDVFFVSRSALQEMLRPVFKDE